MGTPTNPSPFETTLYVTQGKRYTIAHIEMFDPTAKEWVFSMGESSCHPDDDFDSQAGFQLAVGRALSSLGRKLERQGNGRVKWLVNKRRAQELKRSLVAETQTQPLPFASAVQRAIKNLHEAMGAR